MNKHRQLLLILFIIIISSFFVQEYVRRRKVFLNVKVASDKTMIEVYSKMINEYYSKEGALPKTEEKFFIIIKERAKENRINSKGVLIDSFGYPIHYSVTPPHPSINAGHDFFIWSNGRNHINNNGLKDDIGNWDLIDN